LTKLVLNLFLKRFETKLKLIYEEAKGDRNTEGAETFGRTTLARMTFGWIFLWAWNSSSKYTSILFLCHSIGHTYLVSFWYHSVVILVSFWCHYVVILVSFWCHSGVILVSFWCHSGVSLVSFWCHSGVILCCHSVVILLSFCCHSVVILLSFCCHSVVISLNASLLIVSLLKVILHNFSLLNVILHNAILLILKVILLIISVILTTKNILQRQGVILFSAPLVNVPARYIDGLLPLHVSRFCLKNFFGKNISTILFAAQMVVAQTLLK